MPMPGFLTPSSFSDLMTNGKGSNEMGKTAMNIVDRLAMDLLDVDRTEEYIMADLTPFACSWGNDHEWSAIEAYKDRYLCEVIRPDFTVSRKRKYIGGTADGLVGKDGGIEVKCPFNSAEHLANIISGKQIKQYMYQMQGYMLIYKRRWWDFVSYDPRFKEPYCLYVKRIERDDDIIKSLLDRCTLAYRMAKRKTTLIKKEYKKIAI